MSDLDPAFYRSVTTAICSSSEIGSALHRALLALREMMPIDLMIIWVYDDAQSGLRKIAMASEDGGHDSNELMRLNPATRAKLLRMDIPHTVIERTGLNPVVMRIVNHPDADPVARSMKKYFMPQDYSSMVMYLDSDGKRIGTLFVRAEGTQRYEAAHAQLLAQFLEPFTLAAANALHREEMIKHRNALAGDQAHARQSAGNASGDRIIGSEYGLKNVIDMARQVATMTSPVLLRGETGTGKDMIATAIHRLSAFRDGPFVKVNCGAIPEALIDAELFGHEKGAFTGAFYQKLGFFERADKGTIFLDEIGELPPPVQVRLLRVLQFKEIQRVGGSDPIRVNIRVIAATHRDLEQMVAAKQFREDLWFRLNVFPIFIPPLRQRTEDIPELVSHMVTKKSRELNLPGTPLIASSAMKRLAEYDWPGNVRELENIIERALILSRGKIIGIDALFPGDAPRATVPRPAADAIQPLDSLLREHIVSALGHCDGKVQGRGGAAEALDMNPSTLRNLMKRLAIPYGRKAGTEFRRSA
ncbi:sigma-54 interaction domain-containing protein [Propionivibrio dicarboxylicus]|uniref:Transcriptional regulator containing GAF, AAA-type ATPase, and DNA-binding Fis domains n=1 Tax=Propionivibrio dicarboxylicus TaxID=83767 RepID=A0A1G7WDL4_9RHOO|nr:sigma 54-interacting transcriptional regulator [Propionivibrio dicarboxylicus]SDG70026.1 Transcriptional regulator containing GAF, AAA-type ATPase, and DNA-binding Fis domains [Propionivibrio dicarboxylicus]